MAVPVPVRRLFTYRVPDAWRDRVRPGCRVAVSFAGRKLVGYVTESAQTAPAGAKVKEIVAVLDPSPIFPRELLAFLRNAAAYYLHPLGEVLRSAAPALDTKSVRVLRGARFLDQKETLPGRSVARRRVLVVRRQPLQGDCPKLGAKQRRVFDLLGQRPEWSLPELREHVANVRAVVRALEAKGLVSSQERELVVDPYFAAPVPAERPVVPNAAQQRAISRLRSRLGGGPATFLLHGVTGSGKTEVYLQVIAGARALGLGVLMLVPEIALTPQLVGRFRARFGDGIAVLHSGLGQRQRADAWHSLHAARVGIAIGARSAVFAPVPKLGLVIVDEEHDASFKQEDGFRYHGRDMALLRSHRAGAVCVLGSATPSLESYYLSERGKFTLLELPERATAQPLPKVQIVDLGRNRSGPSGHPLLTGPLHRALESCLAQQGQAILFLNRRGFSPAVRCAACRRVMVCPACSVALTEHREQASLRCHYCDFGTPNTRCLACKHPQLLPLGAGTERLQAALSETFAPATVARLDRDTAQKGGLESVLRRLRRREIDILIGTQMVTKGHDMPGVTLVGIVLADQSLAFPDFRASERTFQLLAQVAGRSGRGERAGTVLLQTFQPQHLAVRLAAAHDFASFYRGELALRRELGYPPLTRLAAVRTDAGDEKRARAAADILAKLARAQQAVLTGAVRVLGPAPAPLQRLRGRYRYRLLLRASDRGLLRSVVVRLNARIEQGLTPARATIDIDPVSML
ncbi:MAG: primosomal protein N' [Proteobacteria bacterium]|nr:primosomal protein N' [Pseudomonadota bacterium]